MADLQKLVEELSALTVMEAAELKTMLEETWGVEAAAPMAMGAMPMSAAPAAEEEEEQTEFTVVLQEIGPNKVEVIKIVRSLTSLGLMEAKAVVDGVPSEIMEDVGKDAAKDAKDKLEEAGAKAAVK